VGQQANIARDLIYRYFSADGDTKSTMKNGIYTCVLGVSLSLILSYWWGIYGVVAGTVISNFYSAGEICLRFRRKYGFCVKMRVYLKELMKTEASMLMTAGIVFLLKELYTPASALFSLLLFGTVTVVLFLLNMYMLKIKLFGLSPGSFAQAPPGNIPQ
jgi:peptidoglycan biosynthesis protein MviN/MurJ (putative lipid II flippase)